MILINIDFCSWGTDWELNCFLFLIYFCNIVLFLLTLTVSCFFTFKISINIHIFHYVDKTYYCALRKYFGTFREKTAQVYFQCKVASSAASVCKGNLCSNSIITKGSHFIYNEKKKYLLQLQRFYGRDETLYLWINQFTTMTLKCKG